MNKIPGRGFKIEPDRQPKRVANPADPAKADKKILDVAPNDQGSHASNYGQKFSEKNIKNPRGKNFRGGLEINPAKIEEFNKNFDEDTWQIESLEQLPLAEIREKLIKNSDPATKRNERVTKLLNHVLKNSATTTSLEIFEMIMINFKDFGMNDFWDCAKSLDGPVPLSSEYYQINKNIIKIYSRVHARLQYFEKEKRKNELGRVSESLVEARYVINTREEVMKKIGALNETQEYKNQLESGISKVIENSQEEIKVLEQEKGTLLESFAKYRQKPGNDRTTMERGDLKIQDELEFLKQALARLSNEEIAGVGEKLSLGLALARLSKLRAATAKEINDGDRKNLGELVTDLEKLLLQQGGAASSHHAVKHGSFV